MRKSLTLNATKAPVPLAQMRARRVMVKNSKTPKKRTKRPEIPKPEDPPPAQAHAKEITIAYAKCLEVMMTAPMAKDSEVWRETIIRSRPTRRCVIETPRPVLKKGAGQEVTDENRHPNFIGGVNEGDTFFN